MPASAVRVLRVIAGEGQGDAELLGRFIDRRDEAAFALLVRRHGGMVYDVCRRVLPTDQDAEDAFQATFVVLAEKARTVVPREAVGNWLYGVARRAALLARRAIARRRERMGGVPERPANRSDELRAMLDEEMSRLPADYRTVIVLCDLEGRTRREAAVILGWPEGTVAGRLVRAREMLAKRLAPAVSIAAVLAGTATARVPEVLPTTAPIPAGVAALTREVLGVMARGKLMKAATVALLLGCAGLGMVLQAGQKPATQDSPALPGSTEAPMNPPKADDVVWGQEVDGLQIGLTGVAPAYRHGEKAKMEVRLRNVGKAEAKLTYSLLRESAPQVTADGVRMTVAMPPPLDYYAVPVQRVVKPGETITLYKPEVAVESADMLRLFGELRVDTPTTYLAPGKYKIAFGGMIRSHPKLSTGMVEFEVKDQVAWGEEVGGLQAGLVGPGPVRIGEKAQLAVMLRNVSKEAITLSAWPLWFNSPRVVDADGRPVRATKLPEPSFEIIPTKLTLKPGETALLAKTNIFVADAEAPDQPFADGVVDQFTIHVRPGTYRAAFAGFVLDRQTLSTGTVEFEVRNPELRLPEPDVQEVADPLPVIRGPLQKDGSRGIKARKDVVGRPVRVEGIAWGQPFGLKGQEGTISPHAGPHVVYEGGSVFVRGIDFTEIKARGKPVRVTGTLRFEPKSSTRWGDVKGYYYVEAEGFEVLDAVTDPYLVYLQK